MQVNTWQRAPVEVQQRVLSYVSVANLGRIGHTSHYHYALMKRQVRGRVTSTLANWKLPPETLDFMREHNIVLSGSAVLAIVEPGSVEPNDLDMYVPRGGMGEVEEFLLTNSEYVKTGEGGGGVGLEEEEYTSFPFETGMKSVAFFRHRTANSIVNIIETDGTVATTAVFKFHTTFVMNYVTWNAIVCAYPKMTSDHVGLVNTHLLDIPSRMVRCLIKYAMRGFTPLERVYDWKKEDHDCGEVGYCGRSNRYVGDKYTLRMAFNDGFAIVPDVINERVSWRLNSRYLCAAKRIYRPQRGFVATVAHAEMN
ncbi:hypothetical protein EST38_g9063 [Candolleomyces aberdarensis]|uniref:F-box domain-containing protein n=1 Tax=Candolleomyces aberdarensis TaxID=2316362 RepID=A0A4Q2DAW2_9AGAR|nr:hypothetical protein EST38_g9063 [Candolleomyces aberdarensis]